MVLSRRWCNRNTWFLTFGMISLFHYPETSRREDYSNCYKCDKKNGKSHYFHNPANLCMGNSYRIHHSINSPSSITLFCRTTWSRRNTCLISFKKQKSRRIKIPDSFLVFGSLVSDVRAHTPIVAISITALLHEEHTALLQSCPFLSHNLNLSSFN